MTTRATPELLRLELAPRYAELASARDQLGSWLRRHTGADASVIEALQVVATELCTNAMEAGDDTSPVRVALRCQGGELRLDVDNRVGRTDARRSGPGVTRLPGEGGRGLKIVSALCDDVRVERRGRWLRVSCSKRLTGLVGSTRDAERSGRPGAVSADRR